MPDGLRKVRNASGSALSFVQPETASQILCQALPADQWQQLLGAGPVRREPDVKGTTGACRITGGQQSIDLAMLIARSDFVPDITIGGRPAKIQPGADVFIDVAITDPVAGRVGAQQHPILRLKTSGDPERARRVLDDLVPVLAQPGEPMPAIDPAGAFPFTATPFTRDEFIDLPKPVQALQLCTLMQDKLGHTVIETTAVSGCNVRLPDGKPQLVAMMNAALHLETYDLRIAGRPAFGGHDSDSVIIIRLHDNVPVDLAVGNNNRDLAEKLVPLLL
jgi:hypothetical protein